MNQLHTETRSVRVTVDRPAIIVSASRETAEKKKLKQRFLGSIHGSFERYCTVENIPYLSSIRQYQWSNYFIKDMMGGFTVGVMHIPQGKIHCTIFNVKVYDELRALWEEFVILFEKILKFAIFMELFD